MTHTDARIAAQQNGARGATMCEVTEDCLAAGGILADFEAADALGRRIGALMSKATEIRLTTPSGTDMRAKISNRPVQYETGLFREPGQFGALPNSELNISPIEGTSEGIFIGDVRVMGFGVVADEPVTIEVKDGEVAKISGAKGAEYLETTLASFNDRTAYNLAEFAVGLNPQARGYATNLEGLGKLGFAHHGIGSSYAIGGEVKAPCHIDVIYKDASLELDGKLVMEKGRFLADA